MALMNQAFDNSGSMRRARFSPSLTVHMANLFLKMSGFSEELGTGKQPLVHTEAAPFTWSDGDETNWRRLNRERKKHAQVQQYVNLLRQRGRGSRRASRKVMKAVSRCFG